ncbi:hypothetical protein GE09DRAFT_1122087 [Coniochaeta sp. 2T2.1]|nr:hypothetical protein GE09DRAFT_1122087 [Coniochaeta sp. 2T2.1]
MQTKHRKGGTRYYCHHDACLKKKPPKEFPRADNFRTHLKKMHNITITAEDSLAAYKRAPTPVNEVASTSHTGPSGRENPELLSNVGAAPELIPPADLAGVATGQPSWWQLDQEPQPRMSRTRGTSHQLNLDTSGPSLQSSGGSHTSSMAGPVSTGTSSRSSLGNHRTTIPLTQDSDKDLSDRDRHSHHNYHRQKGYHESQGHKYPTDTAQESRDYVRPNGLAASASPDYASPASAAEDLEGEVIAIDDGEDGGRDETPEEETYPHVEVPKSPGTPPKLSQDRRDHNHSVTDHRASGPEAKCRTPDRSDASPVSDGLFKPGTPLAMDKASASPQEDMEDVDYKFTREELVPHLRKQANDGLLDEPLLQLVKENELDGKLLKLAKNGLLREPLCRQLNDFLVKLGHAPPKVPQAKGSKAATAENWLKHRCPEAYCGKGFRRPCELKKHLKRHQKPYGCTRCSLTFGSKDDWKRHENGQHLQHEVWKCDERLPRTGTCGRICNRKETFKRHLATHHTIKDNVRLDHKLDKCRVSQQGEPQIWCGFCEAIVTLDLVGGRDALNARYDHIGDHYEGGKGLVKKRPGEWLEDDAEAADGELRDSSASRGRGGRTTQLQSRKRSRQGTIIPDPTPGKRARPSPPRDHMMWTCCQCHSTWSFANTASCMSCISAHERCNDCTVEEVEPTEHHLPQVMGFSPAAFEKDVGLHR